MSAPNHISSDEGRNVEQASRGRKHGGRGPHVPSCGQRRRSRPQSDGLEWPQSSPFLSFRLPLLSVCQEGEPNGRKDVLGRVPSSAPDGRSASSRPGARAGILDVRPQRLARRGEHHPGFGSPPPSRTGVHRPGSSAWEPGADLKRRAKR